MELEASSGDPPPPEVTASSPRHADSVINELQEGAQVSEMGVSVLGSEGGWSTVGSWWLVGSDVG